METMGQVFKAARERKRISLATAAAKTRIKIQHLEMMERDDFSRMPAPAYARGFIRIYADFLNLESGPLIEEYNALHAPGARGRAPAATPPAEIAPAAKPEPLPSPRTAKRTRPPITSAVAAALLRVLTPTNLRRAGFIVVAILLVLLVVSGVRRCAHDANTKAHKGSPRRAAPALVEEPPDSYLPIPAQIGDPP